MSIKINTDITESEQESSFMNATLHSVTDLMACSISIEPIYPPQVTTQEEAKAYLIRLLQPLSDANCRIDIQIGASRDIEDELKGLPVNVSEDVMGGFWIVNRDDDVDGYFGYQRCKVINDHTFIFKRDVRDKETVVRKIDINVIDREAALKGFEYDSFDDIKQQSPDTANQIIAECWFDNSF